MALVELASFEKIVGGGRFKAESPEEAVWGGR